MQEEQFGGNLDSQRPKEASRLKSFRPGMWKHDELYVGLSCLAMGDTQAVEVEIAQTCHLGLCAQEGILDESILIAMNLPAPSGKLGCGIVIDDFVSFSIVSADTQAHLREPRAAAQLAEKAEAAYVRENLIPHSEKAERDSLKSQVWGCVIDSEARFVRGSLRRAASLAQIIIQVLEIGAATGGLLEVIAGGLISSFIFRRRLLSLVSEVFEVMKVRERDEAFVIGPALREERVLCVGLLPLAVVELKAEYNEHVFAVDASNGSEAGVSCCVGRTSAKEISRHALRKETWTKLLSPARCREWQHGSLDPRDELPGGAEDAYKAHPLWVLLSRSELQAEVEEICQAATPHQYRRTSSVPEDRGEGET